MMVIAFLVLSLVAVVSALVVVLHRNPVICALALASNLVAVAGFYVLLSAEFIAFLQVIVYAGAILVLILFVIMLLNLPEELKGRPSGPVQRGLGGLLALLLFGILARAVLAVRSGLPGPAPGLGTVESVGRELYGKFYYPFEVVSLLLVAAMIGAVLLAKRKV